MLVNYFTLKAVLRTEKSKLKNNTYPIYLYVQRNGRTQKLSLGERIEEKKWDKVGESAIGKGYQQLNALISKKKQDLNDFILEYKRLGLELSDLDISNFWNGKSNEKLDFYKFYDSFCETHLIDKREATKSHYSTLRKKLKNFKPNLSFSEIDYSFMKAFESYLIKTESGVYNMTKFFKTALGEAHRQKLTKDDSWKEFKVPRPGERKVYLNSEELKAFENCDVAYDKKLQFVKDLFLFSTYVGGMRYGDATRFTKNDYKRNFISIIQEKTNEPLLTYVGLNGKLILAKYITKRKEDEPIFPKSAVSKLNRRLRIIAEKCGIKKYLTFHASRNTFTAQMTEKNVNAFIISKMMGHKKLSQTFSYTSVSAETMKNVYKSIQQANAD